jgi:hypothetical protein
MYRMFIDSTGRPGPVGCQQYHWKVKMHRGDRLVIA